MVWLLTVCVCCAQERYTYHDPITEFVEALYLQFDFEAAQRKLRECDGVLANDFFLAGIKDEFVENSRLFIFETYCRIHQCIDIRYRAPSLCAVLCCAWLWLVL